MDFDKEIKNSYDKLWKDFVAGDFVVDNHKTRQMFFRFYKQAVYPLVEKIHELEEYKVLYKNNLEGF